MKKLNNVTNIPTSVKIIKFLLWFSLIVSITLVVTFIFLASAQPEGGWIDVQYPFVVGFLEGAKGVIGHSDKPIFLTYYEAGRLCGVPILSIIFSGIMLAKFKNKRLSALRLVAVLGGLWIIASHSIPVIYILILLLTFRSSVKSYFGIIPR